MLDSSFLILTLMLLVTYLFQWIWVIGKMQMSLWQMFFVMILQRYSELDSIILSIKESWNQLLRLLINSSNSFPHILKEKLLLYKQVSSLKRQKRKIKKTTTTNNSNCFVRMTKTPKNKKMKEKEQSHNNKDINRENTMKSHNLLLLQSMVSLVNTYYFGIMTDSC